MLSFPEKSSSLKCFFVCTLPISLPSFFKTNSFCIPRLRSGYRLNPLWIVVEWKWKQPDVHEKSVRSFVPAFLPLLLLFHLSLFSLRCFFHFESNFQDVVALVVVAAIVWCCCCYNNLILKNGLLIYNYFFSERAVREEEWIICTILLRRNVYEPYFSFNLQDLAWKFDPLSETFFQENTKQTNCE